MNVTPPATQSQVSRLQLWLLPDDVLRCHIFPACTLPALSALDQALTSRSPRPLFLSALRGCKLDSFVDITCEEMGEWLGDRGVVVQKLQVSYTTSCNLSLYAPHFFNVTHLNLKSFSYISSEDLLLLAKTSQHLIHINLCDCDLTSQTFEILLVNNPALLSISLSDCSSVTDDMLGLLGHRASSLQCLDLSYCTKITDTGLAALVFATVGNMDSIVGDAVDLSPLFSLSELSLAHCRHITDHGLALLLPRCRNMQRLDLGHCTAVEGGVICDVAQLCGDNLEHLLLTNCHELPQSCLFAVASYCKALVCLDVFNCASMVTDETLKALADGCPLLEHLNLYNCKLISNAGLRNMAQGCPKMECLNISSCTQISDSGLYALATHSKQLRSLDMSYCNKITNSGVDALRGDCKMLKSLNLFKCTNVRSLDLVALYSS